MHLQEVFNAISTNHLYEYFIIDSSCNIIEFSDKAFEYCEEVYLGNMISIFDALPELVGLERKIDDIFMNKTAPLMLQHVQKTNRAYVNIYVHPGRKSSVQTDQYRFETLVVLLENVTAEVTVQRSVIQERNEKELLLEKLEKANMQLKEYNEHMQQLVDDAVAKYKKKKELLELKSRHAELGEMIGIITHQWKQPLNAISVMCNLMQVKRKKAPLDIDEFNQVVSNVKQHIKYMADTVTDFQDFFNPAKGKKHFNIKKNIKSVLNLIQPVFEIQNITIELTGSDTLEAYGYPNEFSQVILSILTNAKDAFLASPKDTMRIRIDITARRDGRKLITITDNAGGIPDNIIDSIFENYVTTKQEGSGIGLNVAKTIIEQKMGGEISARNVEDGAEFSIIL